MKKFAKIISLLLAVVFCFSVFGCSSTNEETSSVEETCAHKGIGTCEKCDIDFDVLWKEFIANNGSDNKIGFDGDIGVILTYTDEYDLYLYAQGNNTLTTGIAILALAYNFYDQKWTLLFQWDKEFFGVAYGSFSQWSSRSSSLPVQNETLFSNSDILPEIKRFYNAIINKANEKLSECKIGITMENFGLGN